MYRILYIESGDYLHRVGGILYSAYELIPLSIGMADISTLEEVANYFRYNHVRNAAGHLIKLENNQDLFEIVEV